MSWLTRTQPTAELPTIQAEICVACGHFGGAMNQIPLGDFGQQWVCVHTPSCRQRAQLKGIWLQGGVS